MSEERLQELMMKVIDGVATEAEQQEFEQLLGDANPEMRDEYTAMRRIKEVTDEMQYKEMPDSFWEGYWSAVHNRLERGIGWTLLVIGAARVGGFAIFEFFRCFFLDGSISIILRLGALIAILGSLVLLISVFREMLFARTRERYKEIER
ncbi:MAG: hypothetical protein ABIJ61_01545 [bacterium]